MVLVFNFSSVGQLAVLAVDSKKSVVVNEITLKLPTQLSEKLWAVLPRWFNFKTRKLEAAVLMVTADSEPSYSALRTVVAIMNTLGIGGVPLLTLPLENNLSRLISNINKELVSPNKIYKIKANYYS